MMMHCPTRRRRPLLLLLLLIAKAAAAAAAATSADAPNQQQEKSDGLLGSLLGPVPGAGPFFGDFWQRKPAVIQRRNPTFYHPILRSAELDTILAFGQAGWKLVKRVRGPDMEWWSSSPPEPPAAASTDEDDLVAAAVRRVERAHAAFDKGFSLVVDRLDEKHAGVGRLAAAVEAEVGHRVAANLYWTPGEGAQAFEAHFDWMDAFVLQVEGRKRWRLYDALVEQPRPDMKFKPRAAEVGEPFVDFVLEAGELLYLPAGLIHEAHTLGGADGDDEGAGSAPPSLHLTLGVESTVFGSWESLLLELVAAAATTADERNGGDGGDAGQQEEGDEVLRLRCDGDGRGPTLRQALSGPVDDASPSSLRWGDFLLLAIMHLAGKERQLRRAVPLAPLLVEGAGGQGAVLRTLGKVGALVRENADVKAAVRELKVDEGTGLLKLPRSLGGEGSAERRVQQRIEAADASAVLTMLETPKGVDGLGQALRQLECTLHAHAAAVMRRFSAVGARDREARQRLRREALEQLAWRVSVASAEARMAGEGRPQVFAVGRPGPGGDGEL